MPCTINNNSPYDVKKMVPFVKDLYPYAQKRLGFNRPPVINFDSNPQNATDVLGKTAWYEPNTHTITVLIDDRHPKDILRSISHELVHHAQNCRGEFKSAASTKQGYAQNDEHMREMEREAYEQGNMCFRDWEDSRKNTLKETTYYKNGRLIKMSLKEKIAAIIKYTLGAADETKLEKTEVGEEQLEEGYMDDPDCLRFARKKYAEYGGSPSEYYKRCMGGRESSGGSSPSQAPNTWARKSSLDWDEDIGRFEEGKVKKRDLAAAIHEEVALAPIEEIVPVEEDGVDIASRVNWRDMAEPDYVASNVEDETDEHWMSPDAKEGYKPSEEWNGWQIGDDLTVVMERVKEAVQNHVKALQESDDDASLDEQTVRNIVREALFGERVGDGDKFTKSDDTTMRSAEEVANDPGPEFKAPDDSSEYPEDADLNYPAYKRDLKEEEEDTEEQLEEWHNRTLFEALKKRWTE